MTDRYAGFVVTLASDMREDDAQATLTALRQIRGVLSVEPLPASVEVHIAQQRVDSEWRQRLYDLARTTVTRD